MDLEKGIEEFPSPGAQETILGRLFDHSVGNPQSQIRKDYDDDQADGLEDHKWQDGTIDLVHFCALRSNRFHIEQIKPKRRR